MHVLHLERPQKCVSRCDLILLIINYIFRVSQLRSKQDIYSCIQFPRQPVTKLLLITLQLFSWSNFKTLHPISEFSVPNSAQKLVILSGFPSFSSRKICALNCLLPHFLLLKNAESSYHSHRKTFVVDGDPSNKPSTTSCPDIRAIQ